LGSSGTINGLSVADDDIVAFDGSAVGLSSSRQDVDGLAVDSGNIYLSTTGSFSVNSPSGADEDIFVFTPSSPGSTTSGTYSSTLFFDGNAWVRAVTTSTASIYRRPRGARLLFKGIHCHKFPFVPQRARLFLGP
jgi:hypothetical protein